MEPAPEEPEKVKAKAAPPTIDTEEAVEAALKEIPLEAARAHLRHWWREPVAGMLALGIGVYDVWHFGKDGGITSSLDELMIIGGIVLIAGSRRLFMGLPSPAITKEEKEKK